MTNLSWRWIVLVAVVVVGLIGALIVGGVTDVEVSTVVAALVSGLAGLLGPARAKRVAEDTSKTRRGGR
jgi:predicted membrane metal-binding protein